MGRYYYGAKREADYLKRIETWWLKQHGYLEPGWTKSGGAKWTNGFSGVESSIGFTVSTDELYIEFDYTQTDNDTGETTPFKYKVPLVTTPCRYGGKRYWFECSAIKNGKYCGRRVGVLYKNGDYFACRHCYDLSYSSKNQNRRSSWYASLRLIELYDAGVKLDDKIKRRTYAGKLTRKQRRMIRMSEQLIRYSQLDKTMKKAFNYDVDP